MIWRGSERSGTGCWEASCLARHAHLRRAPRIGAPYADDDGMTLRLNSAKSRAYWRALMANAVTLVADAHLLLDNGSAGRARSLLILAQEELARATALYSTAMAVWEGRKATVDLSTRPGPADPTGARTKPHLTVSKSHQDKIAHSDHYGQYLGPFWGDYAMPIPGRDPVQVDGEKQAGFYVAAAPGPGGMFASPLDIDGAPLAAELERVAGIIEMALIRDHTRRQDLGTEADADSVQDLHTAVLPYAHPELWADFMADMEARHPDDD
jgi:AbiV family abortive infection protein